MNRFDHQDRVQTNTTLTLVETIRAEATAAIKVIRHTGVQTRARSLSVHSQVEPDGFRSQTTRVRHHILAHASWTDRLVGRRLHDPPARFLLYPIP
jgi:hypothetical protein